MNQSPLGRRGFIRNGMIAGAALSMPLGPARAAGPSKRIRVGVIGCGSVSHSYLPHLSQCPYAELVSACDIKPERAAAQAAKFQIQPVSTYR